MSNLALMRTEYKLASILLLSCLLISASAWGKCQRYVKETRKGVEVNLGGGYAGATGQIGVKLTPEVQRLADRALLYLDITQHYYCIEAEKAEKRAREAGDEHERGMFKARQLEMQNKRDEVYKRLTELATKGKESDEALTNLLKEQENELPEYGKGIADKEVTNSLKGVNDAFREAHPFLVEKGIDTGGGSITSQGPVIGRIEVGRQVIIGEQVIVQEGGPAREELERVKKERELAEEERRKARQELERAEESLKQAKRELERAEEERRKAQQERDRELAKKERELAEEARRKAQEELNRAEEERKKAQQELERAEKARRQAEEELEAKEVPSIPPGYPQPTVPSSPAINITGKWVGTTFNTTLGIGATIEIQFQQWGSQVTAYFVVYPPLSGAGTSQGTIFGDSLHLEASGPLGSSSFDGLIQGNHIEGTFVEIFYATGLAQQGVVSVDRMY